MSLRRSRTVSLSRPGRGADTCGRDERTAATTRGCRYTEQIAATDAKNGVPVWLMIAENEGHGFAKKENGDHLFAARVLFLQTFLLGR